MSELIIWDPEQLIDFCLDGNLEKIQLVVSNYPKSINSGLNYTNDTLLHIAVLEEQISLIEYLLSCPDINVNTQNEFGFTPLHFAAEKGLTSILDLLLSDHFIDVNIQDEEGKSPLHQASLCGIVESVERLLARDDIDITITNSNGKTALDVCGGNVYDWTCNDKPKRMTAIKKLFADKKAALKGRRSDSSRSGGSWEEISPRQSFFSGISTLESTNSRRFFDTPRADSQRSEPFSALTQPSPSQPLAAPVINENDRVIEQLPKVLEKKTCPWNRSKIMIVGPGRAGKTALTRSILGEPFEKDLISTIGINQFTCDVKYTGLSTDGEWEKYNEPKKLLEEAIAKEIYRLTHVKNSTKPFETTSTQNSHGLGRKLSFKKSWAKTITTNPEKLPPMTPSSVFNFPDFKATTTSGDESSGEENKEAEGKKEPLPGGMTTYRAPSVQEIDNAVVMECLSKGIHLFDSKYIFSVYDFGGQSIFDVIHPFFLSRYGVYVIVFNMKDFFSNPHSSSERLEECMIQLRFWMNSIAIHSFDSKNNEMAPILFVGTRKDIVKDPTQHEHISNVLYTQFQNHNAWPFVVPNVTGEGQQGATTLWFFPIDNTLGRKDSAVQKLMVSIEEVVAESNYIHEEIPFLWLSIIDELKSTSKSFIHYNDMLALITSKKYQLSPASLPSLLAFLHQMGLLMWYDEEHLRQMIILDPIDYFVKPATLIICKHSITSKDSTIHITPAHKKSMKHFFEDWQCMTKYGIITESLLKALLNAYDYKENIITLMCKFGLLLPLYSIWKAKSFHLINNNRTYLIPSLLPELPFFSGSLLFSAVHPQATHPTEWNAPLVHAPSIIVEEKEGEEEDEGKGPFRRRSTVETADASTPLFSPSTSISAPSIVFYLGFHLSSILKNKTIITTSMMKEYGFLPNGFFERLLCKIIPSCIEDEVHLEDKNISEHIFRNAISYLSYKGQEFHIYCLLKENLLKVEIVNGMNPIPIYLMLQKNLSIICKESYGNLQVCALLEFPFLSFNPSRGLVRTRSTASNGGVTQSSSSVSDGHNNTGELLLIKLSTVEKCIKFNHDLEISLMELQSLASFSTPLNHPPRSLPPSRPSSYSASSPFQHKEKISVSLLKTEYNIWMYQYKQRLMLTNYDIFLSYRWNNADSELVKSLFVHFLYYNLSNHIYSPVSVFLDHQRIQAGEEFREIFVSALLKSRVIIPIITIEALKGMISHQPEKVDNLLLEWILSLACYYYDDHVRDPSVIGGGGSEQKRKILPIIMGSYEIDPNTKEITKLTKIHDQQEIHLPLTHETFSKETILNLLKQRTQSIYPTETMKYAIQLFERHNMVLSEEIQRLSVYQIIDKLLLFQGIIVNHQLYQFPLKLDVLSKEYAEKIMDSVYSIYSYYEENYCPGGGGGGGGGRGNGSDVIITQNPLSTLDHHVSGLSRSLSRGNSKRIDQQDIEHHVNSIVYVRDYTRWDDYYFYNAMHLNPNNTSTTSNNTTSLQRYSSTSRSFSSSQSSSFNSPNVSAKTLLPLPPPVATVSLSPPVSLSSLTRMNGSTRLLTHQMMKDPSSPSGKSPSFFSKTKSMSADTVDGLPVMSNVSQDSMIGDNHQPAVIVGRDQRIPPIRVNVRTPMNIPLSSSSLEVGGVSEVTATMISTSSFASPSVSPDMKNSQKPPSIILPALRMNPNSDPNTSTSSTVIVPTVHLPLSVPPPELTTDRGPTSETSTEIDEQFHRLSQEIELCQQEHSLTMKYFQYRHFFLQKDFIRAKELQVEIKDFKCKYKTSEEYQRYLQQLLSRVEKDFEGQMEELALDEPKYFDDYLMVLQYKQRIQQFLSSAV